MYSAKLLSGNSHPLRFPIPSLLEMPIPTSPPPDSLDGLGARLGERDGDELEERETRCRDAFPRGVVVPSSAVGVDVGEERKSALERREGREEAVVGARGVGVVVPVGSVVTAVEGVRGVSGGNDAIEEVIDSTPSSSRSKSPSSENSSSSVVDSRVSLPSSLDVPPMETTPPLRLLVKVSRAFLSSATTRSSQSASEAFSSSSAPVSLSSSLPM